MNHSREQRCSEFHELEKVAMRYLTTPHLLPKADDLGGWRFCLLLWHFPSFSQCTAWGVYQLHKPGNRQIRSLVRQVVWDRPSDADRFFQPLTGLERGFHIQPTIETRDRPLENKELEARLSELETIAFPAFATRGIGIDGEIFGIDFPNSGTRVEWWCEGPESWKDLTSWASLVRSWLGSVAAATPQLQYWSSPRPELP